MPVEVIDLISSPLPETRLGPPEVSARGLRDSIEKDSRTPSFNPIDLTDEGQDTRDPPVAGEEVQGTHKTGQQCSTRVSSLSLSDDFDTSGDLDGGNDDYLFDPRVRKKPRLSNGQDVSSAENTSGTALPPASLRRPIPATDLDPIEFSSPNMSRSRTSNPGFLDSGLFASSSPVPRDNSGNKVAVPNKPTASALGRDDHRAQSARSPKRPAMWDPISSSAAEQGYENDTLGSPPRELRRNMSDVITVGDSSDDGSQSSEDEFPDVAKVRTRRQNLSFKSRSVPKITRTSRAPSAPRKSAEERAKEREAREVEKQRKKEEREQAKQQRALEKERAAALAEVNKVRTDKKVSAPEMIVHLPTSLSGTTKSQVETLLDGLDVQYETWTSPVDNAIKWSRKVRSRFNEELDHWEPIPLRIEREKHVLVIVQATEFVKLVLEEENISIKCHVSSIRRHFPDHLLIYLIEGLNPWMRKNRTVRNRQFVSAVRTGLSKDPSVPPSSSQSQAQPPPPSRRKKTSTTAPSQVYIDEDTIEDALLDLQVLHSALIHHTSTPLETARQVIALTEHISTAPYRHRRDDANAASAAFCMESGQVRVGDDARDTYVCMLQEIARVTGPVAHGVAAEFRSVTELVRGLETRGPLALEDLPRCANKDGAFSDRRIGQAVSKRLYKVFTGRDERSMDI